MGPRQLIRAAFLVARATPMEPEVEEIPELSAREVVNLQKESRTKDGKRRITPVALSSAPLSVNSVAAAAAPPLIPKTAVLASRIAEAAESSTSAPLAGIAHSSNFPLNAASAPSAITPAPLAASVPSTNTIVSAAPTASDPTCVRPVMRTAAPNPPANGAEEVSTAIAAPPSVTGPPPKRAKSAAKQATLNFTPHGNGTSATASDSREKASDQHRSVDLPNSFPAAPVPVGVAAIQLVSSPAANADPLAGGFSSVIGSTNEGSQALVLEAIPNRSVAVAPRLGTPTSEQGEMDAGCTLRCSRGGDLIWSAALNTAAVLLAGNAAFSAAACADGSLHIFTPAGRRAIPALRVHCSIAALHADNEHSLMRFVRDATPGFVALHDTCTQCSLNV